MVKITLGESTVEFEPSKYFEEEYLEVFEYWNLDETFINEWTLENGEKTSYQKLCDLTDHDMLDVVLKFILAELYDEFDIDRWKYKMEWYSKFCHKMLSKYTN